GDELRTDVPAALPYGQTASNNFEAMIYHASETLITPADNIRLQDVNLSIDLPSRWVSKLQFQNARAFVYLRNLGILWKANEHGLDPRYVHSNYPPAFTTSIGVQLNLK